MIYFYARVSSKDQNLARQLAEAEQYKNIDRVFCDKITGKKFARPEYDALKSILREGDEVIVKEIDRLGRNKPESKEEIKWYAENGIILRILELPTTLIDFNGQEWIREMINNILIEVLTTMAEQEVKKIDRRRAEGIAAMPIVNGKKVSLKTGRNYGRPQVEVDGEFEKFLEKQKRGEISVKECCEHLKISRSTWYNRVSEVV